MNHLIDISRDPKKSTLEKTQETFDFIIHYLKAAEGKSAPEVISLIEKCGMGVSKATPMCFPVINTLKRILSLIKRKVTGEEEPQSDKILAKDGDELVIDLDAIIGELRQIKDEFHNIGHQICDFLISHLDNEETILTFGYSSTLLECFKEAQESDKKLKILVVTNSLNTDAESLLNKLRDDKIEAYEVATSSIYAIMPKVTKVIVSCYAVMSDGGIINQCGIFSLGMMAKEFSVPFLVISTFYKLTPKFCFGQDTYNEFVNPRKIVSPEKLKGVEGIDVLVPTYDFLPPEYITLHITEFGEFTNFYIYRLFNEIYTKEEKNANY